MKRFLFSVGKLKYKVFLRPILFRLDPERVHDRVTALGRMLGNLNLFRKLAELFLSYQNPKYLAQEIHGIKFQNPVGLSAGFDKDGNLVDIMPAVGFGFMQVGSVTLHPYEGNPKPRLIRLLKSRAIQVYYGLKNIGTEKIAERILARQDIDFPLSVSVAMTNREESRTESEAIADYLGSLRILEKTDAGDFYTINISCPNTFGGEPFTKPERLEHLLAEIDTLKIEKPIFVKMPIDLEWPEFDKLLEIIVDHDLQGVIIGNLTKNRDNPEIEEEIPESQKGGISGRPTYEISNELISDTYDNYGDKLTIIGVGGIFNAVHAYEKIKRGASLIQLVTGMIYEGPQVAGQINLELVRHLKRDGFDNVSEAVGSYHRPKQLKID